MRVDDGQGMTGKGALSNPIVKKLCLFGLNFLTSPKTLPPAPEMAIDDPGAKDRRGPLMC